MAELIREDCYIFSVGLEKHILRVQELISAPTDWPCAFRIQLLASPERGAKSFYAATLREVLGLAVAYLSEPLTEAGNPSRAEELASPIVLENLPNRLTCADIVGKPETAKTGDFRTKSRIAESLKALQDLRAQRKPTSSVTD